MKITPSAPGVASVETLILTVNRLKRLIEEYQNLHAEAQAALVAQMEANKRKTYEISKDGYVFRATYKQNTQVSIDEQGLRKQMTAPVFDKYTVKKLDRKKLEQALDDDEQLRLVVAPYVTTKKSAPFVQLTMKEDKNEPDDGEDER